MRKYKFKINNENYIYNDGIMVITSEKEQDLKYIKKLNTFNSNFLNSLNFITNQTCNMKCDYCYANGGNFKNKGKIMNFSIAKKSIDLLFKSLRNNNSKNANIGFIGGEPLLNFKLIKEIVNYVNSNYSKYKINWSIITNFTLINDNIFKFLYDNKFRVIVSIDGNKTMHDLHRKYINGNGSFDDIINNIKNYGNKLNIKVRGTITNDNTDVLAFVREMLKYNIKNISFGYDVALTHENYKKFKKSFNNLIKEYYNDIMCGMFYNIDNISNYILKLVLRIKKDFNCNSGISYRAISPNGDTYLCHRFIDNSNFKFTNINDLNLNSLNKEILIFHNLRNKNKSIKCKKCNVKNMCGGTCYHNSFSTTNNIFKINNLDCLIKKDFIYSAIKLITKLPEDVRKKYIIEMQKIKSCERR